MKAPTGLGRLLFGLLLLYFSPAQAQFRFEKAVRFTTENGLPSNAVQTVKKGDEGFIWVGTKEGLCRFDGFGFKVYRNDAQDPSSIRDNIIYSILPIGDSVWVSTDQGLSILNLKTDKFSNLQFDEHGLKDSLVRDDRMTIFSLFQDRQGDIWFGTRYIGIGRYSRAEKKFIFYKPVESMLKEVLPTTDGTITVLSVTQDRKNDSIIYAGTLLGTTIINRYTDKVISKAFPDPNKSIQTWRNAFRRIYSHDNGLVYIGTWNAGVLVYNPKDSTLSDLFYGDMTDSVMVGSNISGLSRKTEKEIWITSGRGLFVYDTDKRKIIFSRLNNIAKGNYYGVDCVDEMNRVWLSTINGVHVFDPVMQQFADFSFQDQIGNKWGFVFYMDTWSSEETVVVCPRVADGLYVFNKIRRSWTKKPFRELEKMKISNVVVRGFTMDDKKNYILSCDEGLFYYDNKLQTFSKLNYQPDLQYYRFGEVLWDKSGKLWICAAVEGLFQWDSKKKVLRNFKKELEPEGAGLKVNGLSSLMEDSKGNIWFRRNSGYGVYLKEKDSILNFLYTADSTNRFSFIHSFTQDSSGRVWINSGEGWVAYAEVDHPERGIIKKLKIPMSSPSEFIDRLTTDPDGNIWGYTNLKLIKINQADLTFSTYSLGYGLEDLEFYDFGFLRSGEMVFGGRNNIVVAHPADLVRNKERPIPYLTKIDVLQKPFGKEFSIFGKETIRLLYFQNYFSIGFSAQAFTLGRNLHFQYRLLGFDDWNDAGERRFATYTNVPSGDYTFQLRVANNEGVWNTEILELPVFISTAWYNSWWFRIGALILLGAAIYSLVRYRVSQIRRKERIKSEFEKKLANVEMSALLAQMNPHFLFNSLNSIDSYIIRNESAKASEYLNNFARLIRLIFQNSRSNYISLKDELETLDLYLQMESLRFRDKFLYRIEVEEDVDPSGIDIPPMLIQPYVENAIWHGLMHKEDENERKVEVLISKCDSSLVCVIQDNGIGREKAYEYKAKRPPSKGRRSMGMRITHERIEMINKMYNTHTSVKIIDLKNENGEPEGTRVELTIPV